MVDTKWESWQKQGGVVFDWHLLTVNSEFLVPVKDLCLYLSGACCAFYHYAASDMASFHQLPAGILYEDDS